MEIKEIVSKLIGRLTAYGSTEIDNEVSKNIEQVPELVNYLINKLYENGRLINRNEASIQVISKRSIEILEEIKENLDNYLKEINELRKENN